MPARNFEVRPVKGKAEIGSEPVFGAEELKI